MWKTDLGGGSYINVQLLWPTPWCFCWMKRKRCPSDKFGITSAKDLALPLRTWSYFIWIERF